ncbi:tail fiber assembly protein [Xenorhabdus sp. KK7.4]|uniref:tail fiber assembly protein n=1 Tax=Xenorhabdus sp. KK7.4 TaxID=1851572 RepID=UPI000C0430AF|nr:tail fiber assembly protein [Xenorhabdus sp. KK7.4]PHM51746.1 tail fiber protein of a prophage [Xenorhabdus sp. KK7.4]
MSESDNTPIQDNSAIEAAKRKQEWLVYEARGEIDKLREELEQQLRLKQLQWDMYTVKVLEVDLSTAPNIDWPKQPQ